MSTHTEAQAITATAARETVRRAHIENRDRSWPARDHAIELDEARDMIARRRRSVQETAGAFRKDALQRLLAQPGCVGMRIYYGMYEDGRPALILVGVDEHGEELLDGTLLERHFPCPPFCTIGPSLRSAGS